MSQDDETKKIPVTVLTGYLGAGKTTLILSILKALDPDYKVVVLKNEFGDVEVDSLLTSSPSIAGVSEILNGCVCCVLVGQMKSAILEIREKFNPDRIIVESSGSAFPATLAWQIRELERETEGGLTLDAVLTVIDCVNFTGYEDTSPTAKMQASYSDVLLLSKHALVSERQLDTVLDHVYTLNQDTPKIKWSPDVPLDLSLLFGLDSKLFLRRDEEEREFERLGWEGGAGAKHGEEVESWGIYRGGPSPTPSDHSSHVHDDQCSHPAAPSPSSSSTPPPPSAASPPVEWNPLSKFLSTLPPTIYRVKGLLLLTPPPESVLSSASSSSATPFSASTSASLVKASTPEASNDDQTPRLYILNWAFQRYTLTALPPRPDSYDGKFDDVQVRCTVMGERGEVRRWADRLAASVGGTVR